MPLHLPLPARTEVCGTSLLGIARGLEGFGVPWEAVLELMKGAGLHQLQPEGWYQVSRSLAFLAAVERAHGREAVHAMGLAVPDTSKFPPELDSIERALRLLDVAYQVNHRGGPIGRYHHVSQGPGRAEMRCENPYPCDLDHGILTRLVGRFGGEQSEVSHRPGACRREGAPSCVFDLRW